MTEYLQSKNDERLCSSDDVTIFKDAVIDAISTPNIITPYINSPFDINAHDDEIIHLKGLKAKGEEINMRPKGYISINAKDDYDTTATDNIPSENTTTLTNLVDKYWPDASVEDKTEYYNALKTCVASSNVFLQHCKNNDIQIRIVEIKQKKLMNMSRGLIYVSQLGDFFDESRDFYKQATNIKFIGSIINIRNISDVNGKYLDIIKARRTSDSNVANTSMYDINGVVTSISNRDQYTKFIPPTRSEYRTKSITEIISNFTTRDDWNQYKDKVFQKISDMMGNKISPEDIKNSGNRLRCIDMAEPIGFDDILTFDAYKDRCSVVGNMLKKQPGKTVTVHDTYLAVTSIGDEVPYVVTVYGLFILDKSLNDNLKMKLDYNKKYYIMPFLSDEVYEAVYSILPKSPLDDDDTDQDGNQDANANKVDLFEKLKIRYMLSEYNEIVVANNKYVRPYKGEKLGKGEQVMREKYELFTIK